MSVSNAFYTITRSRKYRLFQANIDVQPATTSARRVAVQSTSASASPLTILSKIITPDTPESRAHPDRSNDVWELSVWDPLPVSLRLFCLFSPGHVLVYFIFLPLAPLDPRPSITIFNTVLVQVLLSLQMVFVCSRFTQQARDNAIIQKEVMHEYDTKFVHPLMHPVVRDVAVQVSEDFAEGDIVPTVEVGTPTTLIRRTFRTNGNQYIEGGEPISQTQSPSQAPIVQPKLFTPTTAPRKSDTFLTRSVSSRNVASHRSSLPAGKLPSSMSTNALPYTSSGTFAGNPTSVHARAISPLKKTISLHDLAAHEQPSPALTRESLLSNVDQSSTGQPSSPLRSSEFRKAGRKSFSAGSQQLANATRQRQAQQDSGRPRW